MSETACSMRHAASQRRAATYQKHLEDAARFLVDETRDPLDPTATREATNRRLRDALSEQDDQPRTV